jgi:ribosomal protein S18 acetylase RimI-like enzyme
LFNGEEIVSLHDTTEHQLRKKRVFRVWQRLLKRRNLLASEYGGKHANWLAFRYVLRKTLRIDWQTCTYFKRSLDEPIPEKSPKLEVEIRQATISDLPKLKEIVDEEKYDRFKRRFQKGKICFIAIYKEKVAAFAWISIDNEFEPNLQVEIKLEEKEAYLFDAYVVPEYRNHRLYPALGDTSLRYLRSQGYKNVLFFVGNSNKYSLKSVRSSGFKPNRALTCCSIFGLHCSYWHQCR